MPEGRAGAVRDWYLRPQEVYPCTAGSMDGAIGLGSSLALIVAKGPHVQSALRGGAMPESGTTELQDVSVGGPGDTEEGSPHQLREIVRGAMVTSSSDRMT